MFAALMDVGQTLAGSLATEGNDSGLLATGQDEGGVEVGMEMGMGQHNASADGGMVPYVPVLDRPETYIVTVLYTLIFIVGVLGNGTLVIIFFRHRSMRNIPNTYILSLALADLLVILVCVPVATIVYTQESWPFERNMCRISEFFKDISIGVSVFTLTALSGERYCAIVNPLRKLQVTPHRLHGGDYLDIGHFAGNAIVPGLRHQVLSRVHGQWQHDHRGVLPIPRPGVCEVHGGGQGVHLLPAPAVHYRRPLHHDGQAAPHECPQHARRAAEHAESHPGQSSSSCGPHGGGLCGGVLHLLFPVPRVRAVVPLLSHGGGGLR
ncbi:neuropeptide CCHamide-2 receptor isoform X2 [Drosophila gunungcola]|uniref:neuropeptide CCHamide-2 receptor isoform X2 n=1 Tax=Drosophila gunungcola TaxID=103775 RepID=UPI0022E58F09|nr:neuropeptide CCHamide-2 receptor isoform X2 [Drosophila gunungcola]